MSRETGYHPAGNEAENFKIDKTIAFVDASGQNRDRAFDIAEDEVIKEKEAALAKSGRLGKIWQNIKFTTLHEYKRRKKMFEVEERQEKTGNWYAEEGEQEAMAAELEAVVQRFTTEASEEEHFGEKRQTLEEYFGPEKADTAKAIKASVQDLVKKYADGTLGTKEAFEEARVTAFNGIKDIPDEVKGQMLGYADNMFRVAEQAKTKFEHTKSLTDLDTDFDIIIAKAKTGVRTKAEQGNIDWIIDKAKSLPILNLVDEKTLSAAVSVAYMAGARSFQSVARSFGWALGATAGSAAVGGTYAYLRENKRLKEERAKHARDRAKGKEIEDGSERREEMEQYVHKSISAKESLEAITGSIKKNGEYSKEDIQNLVRAVADLDARVKVSDIHQIDLLRYQNDKTVERERTALDIAKATAKAELTRLQKEGKIEVPPGHSSWKEYYDSLVLVNTSSLVEGKEELDKTFNTFRRKKAAKAALKAAAIGLAMGGAAQEVRAYFHPGETGLVEGIAGAKNEYATTPYEYLRQWVWGSNGNAEDIAAAGGPGGGAGGPEHLWAAAHETPGAGGGDHAALIYEQNTELTPEQYIQKHQGDFSHVHRNLWYDNDTPKPVFDKNELKLWWGGDHNTGLTEKGDYVFDISHMKPKGSYHDQFNVDAQKAIASGKLRLLLSMSEKTQAQVVELPVGQDGHVIIDKTSETAKLFFDIDAKGHAVFKGRFAEVAEMMPPKGTAEGVDQVRLLATYEGKGIDGVTQVIPDTPIAPPVPGAPIPPEIPWPYPPPIIPIHMRDEMEKVTPKDAVLPIGKGKGRSELSPTYGYGSKDFGLLDRQNYESRFAKGLRDNPELDLSTNDKAILEEYFADQDEEYLHELELMNRDIPQMSKDVEVVITIPAFQEGKNIAKTFANYAKLKDKEKFQIVILENHPKGKKRDQTGKEIEKVKKLYPDLNIVHLYKTFDEKPTIGNVRKYLVDSVLLQKQNSGIEKPIVIVSNDADLEDIDENYITQLATRFKEDPEMDAVAAKWDFPSDSFKELPLMHASLRLWQYFDIAFRNYYTKSPSLIGRNSAFRSSSYAAVGGYNPKAELAEDLEIGWLIQEARKYDPDRIKYVNAAGLVSNPRRAIMKMMSRDENGNRGKIVEQYGDFHVNEEVRNASMDELLASQMDFGVPEFQYQAQGIYDFYSRMKKSQGGWAEDWAIDKSFERAMSLMGVQYKIEDNQVIITDVEKLESGLEKFADKDGAVIEKELEVENKIAKEKPKIENYDNLIKAYSKLDRSVVDKKVKDSFNELIKKWKAEGDDWLNTENEQELKALAIKVVESLDNQGIDIPDFVRQEVDDAEPEGNSESSSEIQEADAGAKFTETMERLANKYGVEVEVTPGSAIESWTPAQKLKGINAIEKVLSEMDQKDLAKYLQGVKRIRLNTRGNWFNDGVETVSLPMANLTDKKEFVPPSRVTAFFKDGLIYKLKDAWQYRERKAKGLPPLERNTKRDDEEVVSSIAKDIRFAKIQEKFPNIKIDPTGYSEISVDQKQEALRNFLEASVGLKDGIPDNIDVYLGNKFKMDKGRLVIDITKPVDAIKKDLHAGLRRANPDRRSSILERWQARGDKRVKQVEPEPEPVIEPEPIPEPEPEPTPEPIPEPQPEPTPAESADEEMKALIEEYKKTFNASVKRYEGLRERQVNGWDKKYKKAKEEMDALLNGTGDISKLVFRERANHEGFKGSKKNFIEVVKAGSIYGVPKGFEKAYLMDRQIEDIKKDVQNLATNTESAPEIEQKIKNLQEFIASKHVA